MESENPQIAAKWFARVEIVRDFISRVVTPYTMAPTVLDQTIEGLHMRTFYWLESSLRLNHVGDFQALMTGARATLEAAVDVTLLLDDGPDENGVVGSRLAAMHAWENSAKLHMARKAIDLDGAVNHRDIVEFVTKNEQRINANRLARGWTKKTKRDDVKPNHPSRWTKRDLGTDCDAAERALDPKLRNEWLQCSFKRTYAGIYSWMCWNTHASGLLPMRGTGIDTLHGFCGLAFVHIQQFTLYTGGAVLKHHGALSRHQQDILAFHRECAERLGWSVPA
jgi:hypothetical protein